MTTMTPMTSWDLFEDLRAAQDEMLQAIRGRGWRPGQHYDASGTAAWAPAVDISERKDAYLVTAELPCVKAGEVEITVEDGYQPDAALSTTAAPATGPTGLVPWHNELTWKTAAHR